MSDIELIIKISEETYKDIQSHDWKNGDICYSEEWKAIHNGTPLPKGHGRIGDLDELEQRISNFVEHDANITDEYTVTRQRFIVDGIRQTPTIIEADTQSEE